MRGLFIMLFTALLGCAGRLQGPIRVILPPPEVEVRTDTVWIMPHKAAVFVDGMRKSNPNWNRQVVGFHIAAEDTVDILFDSQHSGKYVLRFVYNTHWNQWHLMENHWDQRHFMEKPP
ncbi:MAG: hypothetical protein FVQ81_02030 [Candidatus Glassbacteria bacterium]|nr:hypothetical protein [Candidatus Glassbacteria bacterium]